MELSWGQLCGTYNTMKLVIVLTLVVERWGANMFESCMGVNGDILCGQAISSMATWKACWLVSCNNLFLILDWFYNPLLLCFHFHNIDHICLFYVDDCILWQDYDSLFSSTQETIHGKLVDFQKELVHIQVWSYLHVPQHYFFF